MTFEKLDQFLDTASASAQTALAQPETYTQFGIILFIYLVAFVAANRIRKYAHLLQVRPDDQEQHPLQRFFGKLGNLIFPLLAILMLRVSVEISGTMLNQDWLVQTALTIAGVFVASRLDATT